MAPLFCPLVSVKDSNESQETYLKDLDVFDTFLRSPFNVDPRPLVDDSSDFNNGQPRNGQIMARMKDQDIAYSVYRFNRHQRMRSHWRRRWRTRQDCRKVILKPVCLREFWVLLSTRPRISGTEITCRVELWQDIRLRGLGLALPWSFGPMGRDKDVFLGQWIVCW